LTLHNFIRKNQRNPDWFDENPCAEIVTDVSYPTPESGASSASLSKWRDEIAKKMWNDYEAWKKSQSH
jgi:hypothetical protein